MEEPADLVQTLFWLEIRNDKENDMTHKLWAQGVGGTDVKVA